MRIRTKVAAALAVGLTCLGPAHALDLYQSERASLGLSVDGMAGAFSTREDYLGEGGKKWREAFIHGVLTGSLRAGEGELYGGLGAIAQGTWGDGDAAGYTNGRERDVDLEDAYLGWRSAGGVFDFSFGRQQFQLGDGFLIAADRVNLGKGLDVLGVDVDRGGAYYIAAKKSFGNTAILRIDPAGPWRGDVFWLKSNNPYQQDTELGGLNLEYVSETYGTLGLSWMKVLGVDKGAGLGIFDSRDGMRIANLRGQGSLGVDNLFVAFEYVDQRGGDTAVKNDADAWFVEGGWTFADVAWSPTLNYRHARFSADKASTTRNEAFDPLFFGLSRGLGTWFQGEVAANYAGPANSGNKVDRLELTLTPREDLAVTLQYWDIRSIGDAADLDGREIDLFAFWQINDKFTFVPLVGIYEPRGKDVKSLQGNDRRNVYLQAVLLFNF
ncbi:alginate export family protein [Thauera sp. SDU_THAU2]|uniref:alginate export family protein n=1 Tax=Thauera sp. SDU_THAU2 TaxID=3136633 RepID=UPI00311E0C53